jgi:hypothetical protein
MELQLYVMKVMKDGLVLNVKMDTLERIIDAESVDQLDFFGF